MGRLIAVLWLLTVGLGFSCQAATVMGVVTGASTGSPVADATVNLERWTGLFYETLGTATTDGQGGYAITNAYTGSARLNVSASGYLPLESPVAMPAGSGTVTANLALQLPAVISGRVIDQATGLPLAGKRLWVHSSVTQYRYTETVSDGSYAFIGLPPASYGVCLIDDRDAYLNQCWNHVTPNSLTFPSNQLPVAVVAGEVRQGIDFDLQAGAHISGLILNRRSGLPVANSPSLVILLRTAAATYVHVPVQLDANGRYRLDGLAPGSYQAIAQSNYPFYTPQLYAGIDCFGLGCEYPTGTGIVIDAALNSRDDIDFSMHPGSRFQGQVVERDSLGPIAGATVELWQRNATFGSVSLMATTQTDAQGLYVLDNVNYSQQHLVVVRSALHIPQRYPNVPCFTDCTSTATSGMSISANATINLAPMLLDRGVKISGRAHLPGQSASAYEVSLFNALGQPVGHVAADVRGAYQFPPWVPGTYYLRSAAGAQCELYQSLSCALPITSGTPVELPTPGNTFTADFSVFVDDILAVGFEAE